MVSSTSRLYQSQNCSCDIGGFLNKGLEGYQQEVSNNTTTKYVVSGVRVELQQQYIDMEGVVSNQRCCKEVKNMHLNDNTKVWEMV
jgi:hypothetical protein